MVALSAIELEPFDGSLADLLDKRGPLGFSDLAAITFQMAEGLRSLTMLKHHPQVGDVIHERLSLKEPEHVPGMTCLIAMLQLPWHSLWLSQ